MKNHVYTSDKQIKLQSKGGAIGLELTGVLAQLFMVWWDRQFKVKMDENGLRLRMYKRYVDDINREIKIHVYSIRQTSVENFSE